jgi:hypothetical protein
MKEDFLIKEGQYWFKNNGEAIAIIRNIENKKISFEGVSEKFCLFDAQNIIEKYANIEKEIFIALNDGSGIGISKNKDGEISLEKQIHDLSKKDNYFNRGEVLETLFWMRNNFYPSFEGMKNIEYKISSKIPNVDNYTVTMKFQNPTKENIPETFLIEEDGKTRCYFNNLKDHNINRLTYGENYIFSQKFDNNTFLGAYTKAIADEFVNYIGEGIDCNILKDEKDFENFIESFNIVSRDGEKIEKIKVDSGYKNGIKFSEALPEVRVEMNNGSFVYNKNNKSTIATKLYSEDSLEKIFEIFKNTKKFSKAEILEVQAGREFLSKNLKKSEAFIYKTVDLKIENINFIQKNIELRPIVAIDKNNNLLVAFEEGKMDNKIIEKYKTKYNDKNVVKIEGTKIINSSNKKKESKKRSI